MNTSDQTTDLTPLGAFTPDQLRDFAAREDKQHFVIEGLLQSPSFNVLAGNSGLGKTPLVASMAVAVASGMPWLHFPVPVAANVLYVNGEMNAQPMSEMLDALSTAAGLSAPPPGLTTYRPDWAGEKERGTSFLQNMDSLIAQVKPSLIIVDPLRAFFGQADYDVKEFERLYRWARSCGSTVLLVHHLRKKNEQADVPSLSTEPGLWLQQMSGLGQILNLTDTRLGVEPYKSAYRQGPDLLMGGLLRGRGELSPVYIRRKMDNYGEPQGYESLRGLTMASDHASALYGQLSAKFKYPDARKLVNGNSDSMTARLLAELTHLGLVAKLPQRQGYEKKVVT